MFLDTELVTCIPSGVIIHGYYFTVFMFVCIILIKPIDGPSAIPLQ